MPKMVSAMPHPIGAGRRRGSSYDRYMDGNVWQFTPSEFPKGGLASFRSLFYSLAKRRGMRVFTEVKEGVLFVQAFPRKEATA